MNRVSAHDTPKTVPQSFPVAPQQAASVQGDRFSRSPAARPAPTPAWSALQPVHGDPAPQADARNLALLIGEERATALLQEFAASDRADIAHWMTPLFMVGDPLLNDGQQAVDLARVVASIPATSRAAVLATAQAKTDELVPASMWKDAIAHAADADEQNANAAQFFLLRWSIEATYLVSEVAVTQAAMGADERAEFLAQSGQTDLVDSLPARVGYEFAASVLWYADLLHRLSQVPRSERPKWLEDTFLGPVENVGNTLSSQISEAGVQAYIEQQAAALIAEAKA